MIFKSTQPEWAATKALYWVMRTQRDLNPRSPSGLRLYINNINEHRAYI